MLTHQQPRVRAEHTPHRHDGQIRLGTVAPRTSTYPDDPWRWTLLEALDGTRTPAQVLDHVQDTHPTTPASLVDTAIRELTWAGHLEDAADRSTVAPGTDAERYDRLAQYLAMVKPHDERTPSDIQRDLARASVTLIGDSTIGSATAYALATSGIGLLHLVDDGTVQPANLPGQFLATPHDTGRTKARTAADRLRHHSPRTTVSAAEGLILDPDALQRTMDGDDLTILAAPNPPHLLPAANRAALTTRTPWIDTSHHGPLISTALYAPGTGTACWECLHRAEATAHGQDDLTTEGLLRALPRPAGHPATAVTTMLTGTLAAHAALAHLTRATPWPPGTVQQYNLVSNTQRTITHPRDPACPACADR
ncbi:ThiF family adenylyltransferase [Kitasatospora sp. NPDC056327]|uniref:HesA/MoeB/ThiF family protein n=1 Tax=Kitasatospora sp. NPDC056327 TaxID=3345785 RepID=UPI0035DD407F